MLVQGKKICILKQPDRQEREFAQTPVATAPVNKWSAKDKAAPVQKLPQIVRMIVLCSFNEQHPTFNIHWTSIESAVGASHT